ncbi:BrnA antitoxin family protein [Falsiroseomonas tokyonensis]|uniref:BrnA antitoxin family protein n=1 Tax=Falsiroseomonas tokyonensis TaxID=430521 RepID=UPI001C203EE3|nr:BrnA antitoxin family protein [Falsiroseomonas tokyonensis]
MPEFAAAATPAKRPAQATITMQIDADVVSWFQQNQPDGMTWQQDMNSVLRFYMDSLQAMERDAPQPDAAPDYIPF